MKKRITIMHALLGEQFFDQEMDLDTTSLGELRDKIAEANTWDELTKEAFYLLEGTKNISLVEDAQYLKDVLDVSQVEVNLSVLQQAPISQSGMDALKSTQTNFMNIDFDELIFPPKNVVSTKRLFSQIRQDLNIPVLNEA